MNYDPANMTQTTCYFLCIILSRYVLFDTLFYDSFCFIVYCVILFLFNCLIV